MFGIAGRKGHGKDACADIIMSNAKRLSSDPINVVKLAFADPIKGACRELFGFSDTQLHDAVAKETVDPRWGITPRKAMQVLGTDLIQQHMDLLLSGIGNKFFVEAMRHRIAELWKKNGDTIIVISDVRFQHEVDLIHELGGRVLRVTRPSTKGKSSDLAVDTHASETLVDTLKHIDNEVLNDGTLSDLSVAVKCVVECSVNRQIDDLSHVAQ